MDLCCLEEKQISGGALSPDTAQIGVPEPSTAMSKIGKEEQISGEVLSPETRQSGGAEPSTATSKIGKFKRMKENAQSPVIALNKFTSQIKKPSYRKNSPLNWFPRKKGDSYLNRKIKLLQEVGGMNSTLDEALGDSNPHYSKVLREKIAVREAACKAMEARKAALVEASWCRILQAARIQNKDGRALLLKAEKNAAEAFEAATAIGVIMYDKPNGSPKQYEVETSCVDGGRSTTHTVTTSFETAFDVDKEVASAVKSAFIRLASSSSLTKDEFKDLLRKISQNPDKSVDNVEVSELTSSCELESGSELQTVAQVDGCSSTNLDCKMQAAETVLTKYKKQSPKKLKMKLVNTMLERLRRLQEDELSSLATIVATCGLSAALAEEGNIQLSDPCSTVEYSIAASDGPIRRKKEVEPEQPSLDKFLVKRMSKLEREVQEAKNARKNQSTDGGKANKGNNVASSDTVPDLGSIFVKHSSKFEKEIEEAKKNSGKEYETVGKKFGRKGTVNDQTKEDAQEVPSLDKLLVKHVSRLEKEVQEAKNRRKNDPTEGCKVTNLKEKAVSFKHPKSTAIRAHGEQGENENENDELNKEVNAISVVEPKECTGESVMRVEEENPNAEETELIHRDIDSENKETIFVKRGTRLEREKIAASLGSNNGYNTHKTKRGGNVINDCESLDKVLVKNRSEEKTMKVNKIQPNVNEEGGLDQILVKHKSRPEKEKTAAAEQAMSSESNLDKDLVKHVSRLQKAKMKANSEEAMAKVKKTDTSHSQLHTNGEGGLDQILVKHKSKLEMEKMAAAAYLQPVEQARSFVSHKEARERELREAWEGLSLENTTRPRLSKLEREKAAWIKAEEEERNHIAPGQ